MNNRQHRIDAFTIIEMMVALVLTALAISFIYAGYRFIRHQGALLTQQLLASGEVDRFYRALQTDNLAADEINYAPYGIDFKNGDKSTVHYLVADSLCIRQTTSQSDTFHIQVDSMACWLAHNRQEIAHKPIDACYFYLLQRGKSFPLVVRKRYDAAKWMHYMDSTSPN